MMQSNKNYFNQISYKISFNASVIRLLKLLFASKSCLKSSRYIVKMFKLLIFFLKDCMVQSFASQTSFTAVEYIMMKTENLFMFCAIWMYHCKIFNCILNKFTSRMFSMSKTKFVMMYWVPCY